MSLGLFNCRLIQTAGDQLFFLSAVLPHWREFGRTPSSYPGDASCSSPTNGRAQNVFCLSFSERFCFGLSPRMQQVYSRRFTRELSPKVPNPTHRFCYRAVFSPGPKLTEEGGAVPCKW